MTSADEIFDLFKRRGAEQYFGESVSVLEHSLQTAALALRSDAPDFLIVAALLHDIGHLLHGLPENIAQQNIDARHEAVGEVWLRSHFGPEVSEPVRLHVDAKRYLCAVDADYPGKLSSSSIQSLHLQGGAFTTAQVQEFETNPYFSDAVKLRRWDDAAKELDASSPPLKSYRSRIDACERNRPRSA